MNIVMNKKKVIYLTISNGSSSRLVDNTKNVQARDGSGILSCLTLRIVEIGWYSDDSVRDLGAQIGFSSLLHLDEDHRRNLFWCEGLALAFIINLNFRLSTIADHFKWPVLHVRLDTSILKSTTNQTFSI